MLIAGVIHHEVENDPDASPMALLDQPIEIRQRPEHGIDGRVIHDVVAAVQHGRRVDRGEPDGVDAERLRSASQMVQVVDEPGQVAYPIAIRVGEAARVDLVDDAVQPPPIGCVQVGHQAASTGTATSSARAWTSGAACTGCALTITSEATAQASRAATISHSVSAIALAVG